jgi:hypothetical protein
VASALAFKHPAGPLECPASFATANDWERRHF